MNSPTTVVFTHTITLDGWNATGADPDAFALDLTPPAAYLGAGGFCQVVCAADPASGQVYALKRLAPQPHWSTSLHQRALACLRRERELLMQLRHPRIPLAYPFGGADEVAMRYIAGHNLRHVLYNSPRPLSEQVALRYAEAICEVLVYLHSLGPRPVIHGDIKPSNVMLDSSGRIWVIDFGLAQHWQPDATCAIADLAMGTPGYTAPEQWLGTPEPRSDVYALGATLFELLAGHRLIHTGVRTRRDCRPGSVRAAMADCMEAALDPRPANRPDSATMLVALRALR